MKVLVSGCKGFIGSHLTKKLLKTGFQVEGISRKRLSANYKLHIVNLVNFPSLMKVNKKDTYDAVIHLGGDTEENDLAVMFKNNVLTTLNLLEYCKEKKIKKFIFVSGHNVYSPSKSFPINENFPTHPLTNYGFTKLIAENLVSYYTRKFNIHSVILRVSSTYGKNQKKDRMVHKLVSNFLHSQNIVIHKYKNGFQKLDLIHVNDVCDGIISSLKLKKQFGIYNIASGKPITVKDLVSILKNNVNSNSLIKTIKLDKNTRNFYYDITLASKELNFKPKISLKEGILVLIS